MAEKRKKNTGEEELSFREYNVAVQLSEDFLATVPSDKEIYTNFVSKVSQEMTDMESEGIKEQTGAGYSVFMQDKTGIYIMNYMMKGFLKNAGNVLKDQLNVPALKKKLTDHAFIFPRKLRFEVDGNIIVECDGSFERPLRAQTPQGEIVTLVKSDLVEAGAIIRFRLVLMDHPELYEKTIKECFKYGRYQGLGQFRNGGFGQFEVIQFEEIK